jgi:hypothetical protein
MSNRRLFIFLEGSDDERFFTRIVVPNIVSRYRSVEIILYACAKNIKVSKYLRSISRRGHDYILAGDIDEEHSIASKKSYLLTRFNNLDPDQIVIVIKEIESWYLAGLDRKNSGELGLKHLRTTDFVTKEDFNSWIPSQYISRITFMNSVLSRFSPEIAQEKNRSFHFFTRKYGLFQNRPLPEDYSADATDATGLNPRPADSGSAYPGDNLSEISPEKDQ